LAPAPIPGKKIDALNLSEAISDLVTNEERRRRVEAIGRQIRTEDGLGWARSIRFAA